jgi:hypothetical protein
MPKSFLSFSDSKIALNITTLGVSSGTNVDRSVASIKELEHKRLTEAARKEPKEANKYSTDDELSENDSDLGLDHQAIQHLVGDIAEDVLGVDGSPLSYFKPASRKTKSG